MQHYLSSEQRQPHHFSGQRVVPQQSMRPSSGGHFLVQQPMVYYPTLMSTNLLLSGVLSDQMTTPILLNASQDHINTTAMDTSQYHNFFYPEQRENPF